MNKETVFTIILDDGQVLTEATRTVSGDWLVSGESFYDNAQVACHFPLRLFVNDDGGIEAESY